MKCINIKSKGVVAYLFYQDVINKFTAMSKDIIGKNLTGIYLHGSLAMNCFNPDKSDIDLIIVIENEISDAKKIDFLEQVVKLNELAPAKGLEMSIVKRKYCKPFMYPTPYELHFSPTHLKWFIDNPENYVANMKGEDKDLAAHFTILNKFGVMLWGEQIENVFGEVSKKAYVESIWSDVEGATKDIADEPMYMTLNLCRVMAFLKEDRYLSKQQGGEWGLAHIQKRYHPIITHALNSYKTNQIMQADMKLAIEFADEILRIIKFEKDQIV